LGFAREQELKAAAAQRDVAKGRHDVAQAQLAYSRITSPITGVVTDLPFYDGETPANGAPIVTVMDVSQVIVRTHISQAEAHERRVGDEARLTARTGAPIPGAAPQTTPALAPTNPPVGVWVRAANPAGALKPGSGLRVEMIAQTVPNALVIPEAAVLTSRSGS